MFNPERAGPHDNESLRDFQAEFEAFLVEHGIVISVKEVYHLNPFGEATEDIRQHSHTIIRSNRTKRSLSVCATTMNWENSPVLASPLFASLAADARILEESERNLLQWAATLDLYPPTVEASSASSIRPRTSLMRCAGYSASTHTCNFSSCPWSTLIR